MIRGIGGVLSSTYFKRQINMMEKSHSGCFAWDFILSGPFLVGRTGDEGLKFKGAFFVTLQILTSAR